MEMQKEKIINKFDHLFVYGAGHYAQIFKEFLGEELIRKLVKAFIVSTKGNNPPELFGVPVIELAELGEDDKEEQIVIAMAKETAMPVEEMLKARGFIAVSYMEEMVDASFLQDKTRRERDKEIDRYFRYFENNKPLFRYIEIETVNRCNGKCKFCPVNVSEVQRPYHKMADEMFRDIVDQLAELQYSGRVALFSNNEAFLDDRVITFAKYCREKLPMAYIYITTNGTMLNNRNFELIMPYLDGLNIDIYGEELPIKTPENIQQILESPSYILWQKKIRITKIDSNAIRSSRGGKSPNSQVTYTVNDQCPLPLTQMVIRPDGKVSLCCNDALGLMTLGDLKDQTLKEIWYSEKYGRIREAVHAGREQIELCKYCDYLDRRELWNNDGSGFNQEEGEDEAEKE